MTKRVTAGPFTLELPANGVAILYEADRSGTDHRLPGGVGYFDALIQFAGEVIRLQAMINFFDYRCDCCDNGLRAEWDFCPYCGKIQREEPSGLCLAGLASNKACRPDDTLKRCTICGFVVDTQYAAEKPTTHLRPTKGEPAQPPYPFCRTPDRCAGKGYCPRDPACNE